MTIENCRPVRAVLHTEWQHLREQEEVSSPSVISGQSLVSPLLCHYFHFHRHIDCILEKVNWSSLVFLRHSGPQPGRASISQILFRKQYFGNGFVEKFFAERFFSFVESPSSGPQFLSVWLASVSSPTLFTAQSIPTKRQFQTKCVSKLRFAGVGWMSVVRGVRGWKSIRWISYPGNTKAQIVLYNINLPKVAIAATYHAHHFFQTGWVQHSSPCSG